MAQEYLDFGGADEQRFEAYLDAVSAVLGHADRIGPACNYCTGLLLPGERKSIEPVAARVSPQRVPAAHQSLHHLIAKAEWSDEAVLAVVRSHALPAIERQSPIRHWIVDDTGFPKKGRHSVGVARQYCGQLGQPDNCQVAVTLALANDQASLPVAYRLYLPEAWATDPDRRVKAGVAETIGFQTKPEIALEQIRRAVDQGLPVGVVLADAGYGIDTTFRANLTELDLLYVVGVPSSTGLWPPGAEPLPPKAWSGRGRPPKLLRRTPDRKPMSAVDLAKSLPEDAWGTVVWREGSRGELASRFAGVRVRPAHRDHRHSQPHGQEWLLIEWPEGEEKPSKHWLSTLPAETPIEDRVATAKARWRIERDFQELKQEIGLGHYEGRGWRGGHHHASLCIAADGFLVAERCLSPLKDASSATASGHLRFPSASGGVAPVRPERHVPTSIASVRRRLIAGLVCRLPRCPCCLRTQDSSCRPLMTQ